MEERLATYGTLAPGRSNYHQLSGLEGTWSTGTVRGHLKQEGWGAEEGFPGIVLDPVGDEVEVFIFTSRELSKHWDRLDDFEGAGYRRETVTALTESGPVAVSIYALSPKPDR